jgi:hypothetical protein
MNRWARLRWLLPLLAVIDWLLGTKLLERATRSWRQEFETIQSEISSLQTRIEELDASRGAILRHLCLSYLQLRQVNYPQSWLHFDPRDPAEESAVEILTRALVAPHWARWQVTELAAEDAGHRYTYDLIPDWCALHEDALDHAASFPASLLDWLREQLGEKGGNGRQRSTWKNSSSKANTN